MPITNVSIIDNVQIPALGGGFVYMITASCDLDTSNSADLEPILTAAGLISAGVEVLAVSTAGDRDIANGGVALFPITGGGNDLEYRKADDGSIGLGPGGAVGDAMLRLVVLG